MQIKTTLLACVTIIALSAPAFAECSGSNGRGWASGKGNGAF